jgi:hypothetical protein
MENGILEPRLVYWHFARPEAVIDMLALVKVAVNFSEVV